MRKRNPKHGDMRQRKIFLWKPLVAAIGDKRPTLCFGKIDDYTVRTERRWLEFAVIEEQWVAYDGMPLEGSWTVLRFID